MTDDGEKMRERLRAATEASQAEAERLAQERRVVVRAKALAMELVEEVLAAAPGLVAKLLEAAGSRETEAARKLLERGIERARERGLAP